MFPMTMRRRELLIGCGMLMSSVGRAIAAPSFPRRLTLVHAHTGEVFDGPYRDADGPIPDAVTDLARFLRDHRADKIGPVDVETLDLLADILDAVNERRATVLSAFRTPETNRMLMARGLGVAEHSQHLLGRALDVTLSSHLPEARMKALELKRGGVGWYPRSFFLHIDTGPVRGWEMGGSGLLDNLFAPGVRGHVKTVGERMKLHRALARRQMLARRSRSTDKPR